jgi:DNA-binding LacI/PurR family transcriptional regulator
VRLIDIAQRLGVSKSAVARALSRPPERSELRPETYERIHREARDMGYRAGTRAAAARMAALAYGTSGPPLFGVPGHIVAIFGAALAGYGRDLALLRGGDGERWIERALAREVEAVAVLFPEPPGTLAASARIGVPVVAIDSCHEQELPRVLMDDVGNGRRLTECLLELGHRRVDFLAPLGREGSDHPSRARRIAGWREAMRVAGGDGRLLAWGRASDTAELSALLRSRQAPTGLVCYSDDEAFGALQLAASLGLAVPDRLSVIGCNAERVVSWPPLTSMYLNPDVVAKAAARLLVDLAEGRVEPPREPILVGGEIRPGASIAAPTPTGLSAPRQRAKPRRPRHS